MYIITTPIEVYVSYLKKVGKIIRGKNWLTFLGVSDQEIQTISQLDYRRLATFPQRSSLKMELIIMTDLM